MSDIKQLAETVIAGFGYAIALLAALGAAVLVGLFVRHLIEIRRD